MKRILTCMPLCLGLILLYHQAFSYELIGYKWADADPPSAGYALNRINLPPSNLTFYDFFIATTHAFKTWNNVEGSDFVFYLDSYSYANPAVSMDGINAVSWSSTGEDMGEALGLTYRWGNPSTGYFYDVDIKLNAAASWSLLGEAGKYDLQSVITHEAGHFAGLADLYGASDRGKTMFGYIYPGDKGPRTLHADDEAGLSYLYPANELVILTSSLPKAFTGKGYKQQLYAGGGSEPYTWSIYSGALPEGLILNGDMGVIAGTPELEGAFSFTLNLKDNEGTEQERAFTIEVKTMLDADIFGLEVGNSWTTKKGSDTIVENVVSIDTSTFPVNTYVIEDFKNKIFKGRLWFERTEKEIKMWGEYDSRYGMMAFSSGLTYCWYPMEAGESRNSNTTSNISINGISVVVGMGLTVTVESMETVTISLGTFSAFKLRMDHLIWFPDYPQQPEESVTSYQWVVPYLVGIKSMDSDSIESELISFTVGGGTITEETDTDEDGLKDYEELVIYGTDRLDIDTDGDNFDDGTEVFIGRNPTGMESWQGDINGDSCVNLADAIEAIQILTGKRMILEINMENADLNGDGKVGMEEVICVLQRISGLRN